MKPIIVLPPKAMSDDDVLSLKENGLCVVVAENPSAVTFVDPIPSISSRTEIEDAAIQLSRKILSPTFWSTNSTRQEMASAYVDILIRGTPLDPGPSKQEREQKAFDEAKLEELRRLAREEAKAERVAKKQPK